jgi:hypothetical protein
MPEPGAWAYLLLIAVLTVTATVSTARAESFIRLHTPDGIHVVLNVETIVSIRAPRAQDKRTLGQSVHCVVFTSDGKFLGAVDECEEIEALVDKARKK